MSYQNKASQLRLLADGLRRINDQSAISLAQAQEVCGRLGEIIYFLDELAAITLETTHKPYPPMSQPIIPSDIRCRPIACAGNISSASTKCAIATSLKQPAG
jgi:hypothetical protein